MKSTQVNIINKTNLAVRPLKIDDIKVIHQIIEYHLTNTYSKIYSNEIVNFYKSYHSADNIIEDSNNGYVLILLFSFEIVGTGTIRNNYINRMFVKKRFQNKGYGTVILSELEKMSDNKKKSIRLDAIPGSELFYLKNQYTINCQAFDKIRNKYLEYFKMEKLL